MVDVFHVMYEEDLIPQYEQHAEIKSAVRTSIYREFYDKEYPYKIKSAEERRFIPDDPDDLDLPPEQQPTKPFIPATAPEDLPGILDAPLGS